MRSLVLFIKSLHIVFFFLLSGSILYVLFSGMFNRITSWTWNAIAVIVSEVLILTVFRGRCPLTILAERYGAENGRVSNYFMPRWLSDRILSIYLALATVGCILVVTRALQEKIAL